MIFEKNKRILWCALVSLLLPVLAGCGGVDTHHALTLRPPFDPTLWLRGQLKGTMLILDRNGNLRESADIIRNCDDLHGQQGTCTESIHYYYNNRNLSRELHWTAHYTDHEFATFTFKDDAGSVKGNLYGSLLHLSGDRQIPATESDSDTGTVDVRIYRLPGDADRVFEVIEYTMWGVHMGRVEIYWQR